MSAVGPTATTSSEDASQWIQAIDLANPVLSIRPTDNIVFNMTQWEKDGKTEPRAYLYLTNRTSSPVLFKTRATHPRRYLAGPASGMIPAGGEMVIKIMMNPKEDQLPEDSEKRAKRVDRFVVLSYPVIVTPYPDIRLYSKIWELLVQSHKPKESKYAYFENMFRCKIATEKDKFGDTLTSSAASAPIPPPAFVPSAPSPLQTPETTAGEAGEEKKASSDASDTESTMTSLVSIDFSNRGRALTETSIGGLEKPASQLALSKTGVLPSGLAGAVAEHQKSEAAKSEVAKTDLSKSSPALEYGSENSSSKGGGGEVNKLAALKPGATVGVTINKERYDELISKVENYQQVVNYASKLNADLEKMEEENKKLHQLLNQQILESDNLRKTVHAQEELMRQRSNAIQVQKQEQENMANAIRQRLKKEDSSEEKTSTSNSRESTASQHDNGGMTLLQALILAFVCFVIGRIL
eukprot:TRINITY_DN7212_c0_g1_i1.p1 TRINITY_DN7212_c0_g1~~TRINITY_DN7212_c0_g1_i1.p1  ORF type:complete len:482 (+),score=125.16 TRINITY_DN7212_c0_g1_i1:48-1448(+)